jgi:Lon protease-like protein
MVDVALFPIPNAVSFPGVPFPLHVFEPRYRQMVRHCLEEDMLMGVCHTEKLLHHHEREQTVEEALNSNQATYKPCDVFSAGPVELLEELPDGRLLIQVDTQLRLRLLEERQTLPFNIWACEELADEAISDDEISQALVQSKNKILHRLIAITHQSPKLQALLKSDRWQTMAPQPFSFAVSGMLGVDSQMAQQLLQTTDTQHRLDTVLGIINGMN